MCQFFIQIEKVKFKYVLTQTMDDFNDFIELF